MGKNKNKVELDIDALTQGKRYVFYSSLRKEPREDYRDLYDQALEIITTYKQQFSYNPKSKNDQSIINALNFLRDSAEFERQKELLFFQKFETAHPEIRSLFNIKIEDIVNDYEGFITNINRALKGTEQLQKEVRAEITRIEKNRTALETYEKNKKIGKNANTDYDTYLKDIQKDLDKERSINNSLFYMKANGISAFQGMFKNNGHMGILSRLIIEKFGYRLFDKNLKLNERETSALIAAITMKANELFCSTIKLPSIRGTVTKTSQDVINNPQLEKFVDNLLDSPDLKLVMQSIMDQYAYNKNKQKDIRDLDIKIDRIKESLRKNWQELSKLKKTNLNFDDWLKQMGVTEGKLKQMIQASTLISTQCYYVGEDLSLLDLVANHIRGVLGGNTNPTDDIQAGALITSFELNENELEKLEEQLWDKQRTAFTTQVDRTTTYQSYLNNISALKAARQEQQQLLNNFMVENKNGQESLKKLLQHINIHSTVKGYESAGSDSFLKDGGFSGAAFGSTLDDELNIINDMINSGGIDMQFDVEDMFIAMINCGNLMIGGKAGLKPVLINYFSLFMGMFMFNDASLFAEDVKQWLDNQKIMKGNVQDLHLYQLNGIMVPSSYILQKTYEAMSKLTTINSKYKGVRAKFTTYNKNYIPGKWEETSAKAISETKLERMHFLAGFFDLLDNINIRLCNLT